MSPTVKAKAPPRSNGQPSTASAASATLDRKAILAKIAAGELDAGKAYELLEAMQSDRPRGTLICKVSEKRACSVYGLQRMPVTLYVEQWERLLAFAEELQKFLKANDSRLSRKVREAK